MFIIYKKNLIFCNLIQCLMKWYLLNYIKFLLFQLLIDKFITLNSNLIKFRLYIISSLIKSKIISRKSARTINLQKFQMIRNLTVSIVAFLQQIQSWGITLARQSKKLKSLKASVKNHFKINSIDIILTEIQSLFIKYKKIKNKYYSYTQNQNLPPNQNQEKFHNQKDFSDEILTEYSRLSKSFMDILEKISLVQAENSQQNTLVLDDTENQNYIKPNNRSLIKPNQKTFLNQTFSYKASKHAKNKANQSLFQQRKNEKIKTQSVKRNEFRQKAHSMISAGNQVSNLSLSNPKTSNNVYSKKNSNKNQKIDLISTDQDTNLWQIRHQLSQIKTMMKEMKNQIKFHQHEQTNKQISNIEKTNRKITAQLKSTKEDNKFLMQKLDELKSQLIQQKKIQVDLINRFQRKSSSIINYTQFKQSRAVRDSRATHGQNYKSINAEKTPITNRRTQQKDANLSQWVRMRI